MLINVVTSTYEYRNERDNAVRAYGDWTVAC